MMAARSVTVLALLALAAAPAVAVAAQDTAAARAPVPPELGAAVERVARLEVRVLQGAPDTAAARALEASLADARAELARLLDRHVVDAEDGAAVLATLRQRHPGATVLDRYAADLALRDGRPAEAADAYRRLLALRPDDPALHRGLARAHEALGRTEAAWVAYRRAFDLDPGSGPVFRALVRLATDPARLEAVLRQVRRLRALGEDATLLEREVELLHRLDRPGEARRVLEAARDSSGAPGAAGAPGAPGAPGDDPAGRAVGGAS